MKGRKLNIQDSISYSESCSGKSFWFLNKKHSFKDEVDWNFSDYGRLWTYNLNYFEFVLQKNADLNNSITLISDYIKQRSHLCDGLESYPISLRAINWIKFVSQNSVPTELLMEMQDFLSKDFSYLCRNIEYHLLGNHLLENGFALLFGSYFFEDETLYLKARKILCSELQEQILQDGAHFELSPMYHQIMLFRLLDCINLLQNNPWKEQELLEIVSRSAGKMLGWLNEVTFSNGDIPFVNDSVSGVAPTTAQLNEYALRLGVSSQAVILKDSGYRVFRNQSFELFCDVGAIGPDYLPAHAHADTLSFVLYADEKPLIVDPGISTYEKNERRQLERSTVFHNTVTVGDMNSSDVWGGFRVAKRARISSLVEKKSFLEAAHDAFPHKRIWSIAEKSITVVDTVDGFATLHIHFYPTVTVQQESNSVIANNYQIKFKCFDSCCVSSYDYCTGYNVLDKACKVQIKFKNQLEWIITSQ